MLSISLPRDGVIGMRILVTALNEFVSRASVIFGCDERLHAIMLSLRRRIDRRRQMVSDTDMPKYIVSHPAITLCIESRSASARLHSGVDFWASAIDPVEAISGRTMEFNGSGKCVTGCS
jgi:hypothetical protein